MEHTILRYKLAHARFRGVEPTPEEIHDGIMNRLMEYGGPIQDVDGVMMKPRGCRAYGGCACTGECKQLIPASELDVMANEFKDKVSKQLKKELNL